MIKLPVVVLIFVGFTSGLSQRTRREDLPTSELLTELPTSGQVSKISTLLNPCRGPDELPGICAPLATCERLVSRLKENQTHTDFRDFLKESNKICGGEYAVICCPLFNLPKPKNPDDFKTRLPGIDDECGVVYQFNIKHEFSIVGGSKSTVGRWPWMALIGYDDGGVGTPFKCGGALITRQHVLTAAHCVRPDLTFVRLGEYDLGTDAETNHLDVPVSRALKHPDYNRVDGHNDIALLYLDQAVELTGKINFICLPTTPDLRKRHYVNQSPFVAGWGRTMEGGSPSAVLQDLRIQVLGNDVCKDLYKKQNKLVSEQQFDDAVLCAGYVRGGKDTCQGDSGGPLMMPENYKHRDRYVMIGVVSFGIGCARPDSPGAYTRVAKFMDRIEEGVAGELEKKINQSSHK